MASKGIDYGLGRTNIDQATGIRYGVISSHAISQAWYDSAEADYGEPTCAECGNAAISSDTSDEYFAGDAPDWFTGKDYFCPTCKRCFWSDSAYSDEALGYSYSGDGYEMTDCLDSDVMVLKSKYYTFGPFCSPCVPGAVSLPDDPDQSWTADNGIKAYCLGHNWFEDGKAPYHVYRVSDDSEVLPE